MPQTRAPDAVLGTPDVLPYPKITGLLQGARKCLINIFLKSSFTLVMAPNPMRFARSGQSVDPQPSKPTAGNSCDNFNCGISWDLWGSDGISGTTSHLMPLSWSPGYVLVGLFNQF